MADTDFTKPPELAVLAEEFTCSICKQLFDGPVSLNCGHVFCSACIRQSLAYCHSKNQKQFCPACREPSEAAALRPVVNVKMAITALPDVAQAVEALRRRAQEAERRAAAAEAEIAALRAQLFSLEPERSRAAGTAVAEHCAAHGEPSDEVGVDLDARGSPGALAQLPDGVPQLSTAGPGQRHGARPPAVDVPSPSSDLLAADEEDEGGGDHTASKLGQPAKRAKLDLDASIGGARNTDAANGDGGAGGAGVVQEGDDAVLRRGQDGGGDDQHRQGRSGMLDYQDGDDGDGGRGDGGGDANDDDDDDYSPGSSHRGGARSSRPGRGAAALPPAIGQKRRRGRPPKSASARAGGGASAGRSYAPGAPGPPPCGGDAAALAASQQAAGCTGAAGGSGGMAECPVCGSRYTVAQLQAHVETCLVRRGVGSTGAGSRGGLWLGPTASGAGARNPGFGAAAVAQALAPAPPLPGNTAVAAAAPKAPPAPASDIQIPPARNFHPMKVPAVKKLLQEWGLPISSDKTEMADTYNRFRGFLQTEKDRGSTKTKPQLLSAFMKLERQAATAKRMPAEAPDWMQDMIAANNAKMAAELTARRMQAARRAAAASEPPLAQRPPEQQQHQPPEGGNQPGHGQGPDPPEDQEQGREQLPSGYGVTAYAAAPAAAIAAPAAIPEPDPGQDDQTRPVSAQADVPPESEEGPAQGSMAALDGLGPAMNAAAATAAPAAGSLMEAQPPTPSATAAEQDNRGARGPATEEGPGARPAGVLTGLTTPGAATCLARGLAPSAVHSARVRGLLKEVITIDDSDDEQEEAKQQQQPEQGQHRASAVWQGGPVDQAVGDMGSNVQAPGEGAAAPPGEERLWRLWQGLRVRGGRGMPEEGKAPMAGSGSAEAVEMSVDGYGGDGAVQSGGAATAGASAMLVCLSEVGGRSDGDKVVTADALGRLTSITAAAGAGRSDAAHVPALTECLTTPHQISGPQSGTALRAPHADTPAANGSASAVAAPVFTSTAALEPGPYGPTPPPAPACQPGSGAAVGGGSTGCPGTASWRGLLLPPLPQLPFTAAAGLSDISNGTGGQRPAMTTPGMKGPMQAAMGADGIGLPMHPLPNPSPYHPLPNPSPCPGPNGFTG